MRQVTRSQRHKVTSKIILALVVMWMMAPAVFASTYTFDVSLVSRALDVTRSTENTLGFDNWYVWTYRVDVVSGDASRSALSNWMLELPNCYVESPLLFREVAASAGQGDGDKVRVYDFEAKDSADPNLGLLGLKWEWSFESGDELDTIGEFDYFWFSAPTNVSVETDWAAKAGGNIISGTTEGPECPGCDPGVPEPASLVLLGVGLLAGVLRRGKVRRVL